MKILTFQTYLNQYQILEKKMINISDFVTISKNNYDTFSNEFIFMLLNICSEFDSLADEFCNELGVNNQKEKYGINKKMTIILNNHPKLYSWKCKTVFPIEEIHLVPFNKLNNNDTPEWWKCYNLIKHYRSQKNEHGVYNFQYANLKNVLNALSALYIMLYKTKEEFCNDFPLKPYSSLFEIDFID